LSKKRRTQRRTDRIGGRGRKEQKAKKEGRPQRGRVNAILWRAIGTKWVGEKQKEPDTWKKYQHEGGEAAYRGDEGGRRRRINRKSLEGSGVPQMPGLEQKAV